MFSLHVRIEPMWNLIKVVFIDAAYKAVGLHVLLHGLELVTELTEGIDDQTLQNGQQNDDDEEEEGYVEYDPVDLGVVSVGRLQLVPDTTAGAHSLVQVEHEARQHVMTVPVDLVIFLLDVELAEEIESDHSVYVHDDRKQHHC